jgi:glycosyltransferase involved in cell wall biosynthesis
MTQADADIYFQEAASAGTFLVAMWCKPHGRKFAYRTANQGECDGTYFGKNKLMRAAFAWSLRRAAAVFTQNDIDSKNILNLYGVNSEVMRNGHRIMPLTSDERNSILWVGRSDKIKRPELFIDLAGKMPSEKFIMICQRATGDNEYDTLTARARQLKNLEFIERVPFAEIDGFFQRARVFVNTSDTEGFPNTFIQACKYAVPVVSLNVNPDGFLAQYNCGIACGGDLAKCVDALQYMLAENRYIELGKNARKYAEQKHDFKIIIEEYKRLFNALL